MAADIPKTNLTGTLWLVVKAQIKENTEYKTDYLINGSK